MSRNRIDTADIYLSRDHFLETFRDFYEEYQNFNSHEYTMRTIATYIDNRYPDTTRFLGLFTRKVFYDEKVTQLHEEGMYRVVIQNLDHIRKFVRFYNFVKQKRSCKYIKLSALMCDFEVDDDLFGYYSKLTGIVNNIKKGWVYARTE